MKHVIFAFSLLALLVSPMAQEKKTWGIWYNSYQEPYVSLQEKSDKDLFTKHLAFFKEIGINRVYFLVKFPTGHVFYDSKIAPRYKSLDWDPFDFVVKECRRLNLEIFPYVNIFSEGDFNEKTRQYDIIGPYLEKNPEHIMVDQHGKKYGWACPSAEAVIEYELSIIREILTNYSVDGIQLDRIRYPDSKVCYNQSCIGLYEKKFGKKPDAADYDWIVFRQELLSDFVARAYRMVKEIAPKVVFSAAVFPRPYATQFEQLQAWPRWCQRESLDEVASMTYYQTTDPFKLYLRQNLELTPPHIPFLAGIGTFFIKDPQVVEEQISFALDRGVQGIVFFNGYHLLVEPYGAMLKKFTAKK